MPCSTASVSFTASSSCCKGAFVNNVAGYTALPQRGCSTICVRQQEQAAVAHSSTSGLCLQLVDAGVQSAAAAAMHDLSAARATSATLPAHTADSDLPILQCWLPTPLPSGPDSARTLQQPAFCVLNPSSTDSPSTSGYTLLVPCWIICRHRQQGQGQQSSATYSCWAAPGAQASLCVSPLPRTGWVK